MKRGACLRAATLYTAQVSRRECGPAESTGSSLRVGPVYPSSIGNELILVVDEEGRSCELSKLPAL
jgi:hypothetical protein